jgi:3'-phosphoadenosine 5'-phosphosulfate sulfotransferase (PAPS reductase)/FAD synthetase
VARGAISYSADLSPAWSNHSCGSRGIQRSLHAASLRTGAHQERSGGVLMSGPEKRVLGLSGGRESAALAVYMRQRHPELDIDYFFTDTGKELLEVYEFLVRLEGFLGKPIVRLFGMTVYSYVAIRSDEEYREGHSSTHERLIVRLPFKEAVGLEVISH